MTGVALALGESAPASRLCPPRPCPSPAPAAPAAPEFGLMEPRGWLSSAVAGFALEALRSRSQGTELPPVSVSEGVSAPWLRYPWGQCRGPAGAGGTPL